MASTGQGGRQRAQPMQRSSSIQATRRRRFDAVRRVQRQVLASQQFGQGLDRGAASGRALIDRRLAGRDGGGIGTAAGVAATRALRLRQQRIDAARAPPFSMARSFHPHAGRRARVGRQYEDVCAAGAGREHHALRGAEAHFARLEIRDHDDEPADERCWIVGGADAREDLPLAELAHIEMQLQQLVGPGRSAAHRAPWRRADRSRRNSSMEMGGARWPRRDAAARRLRRPASARRGAAGAAVRGAAPCRHRTAHRAASGRRGSSGARRD